MCGIVGQVGKQSNQKQQAQALASLRHRGPDAEGNWRSSQGNVWLAQRRLSIIDLSETGRQPMCNEDRTLWLICNGEIYNYPVLRQQLEKTGHIFYSNSDNEVILHAYEQWGTSLVDYLEGMFAFALWDENSQRLLLARDRVGIKPLYYCVVDGHLSFASEARGILPLLETKPAINSLSLAYFMSLGYIPAPHAIWKGIHKLEAGNLLIWQPEQGIQQHRYWEPPRHIDIDTSFETDKWQMLFQEVLKDHLLSDVPVGLFLSGGLDSSSVALGLCELKNPVETLTISFPGSLDNEGPIARDLAKMLGLEHRIIALQSQNVNQLLEQVAAAYDEPQGYSALLSMYLVSQAGSQNYKVILAGDGGDEVFGGYTWYRWAQPLSNMRHVRRRVRMLMKRQQVSASADTFMKKSSLHRHSWNLYPRFLPDEIANLLLPMDLYFDDEQMLDPLKKHFVPELPLKRALQRVDLMTFCTDSILAKVDRASMAHSLEVRVPFLDRRIIEWGLIRPIHQKETIVSKPILYNYMNGKVPQSVLDHPKQGFSLRVLDDYDWDGAIDFIREGVWVRDGYWNSEWETLIQPGIQYRTGRIWNLLMLTHWGNLWLS